MVDVTMLNSSIIFKKLNRPDRERQSNNFHINFCLDVGYKLIDAQVSICFKFQCASQNFNFKMNAKKRSAVELLGYTVRPCDYNSSAATSRVDSKKKRRCVTCGTTSDKKTTMRCSTCEVFVCKKHSVSFVKCSKCLG